MQTWVTVVMDDFKSATNCLLLFCGDRNGRSRKPASGKLDLTDTIKDGARVVATDAGLRQQLLMAFTEDSRLHIREVFWNFGIQIYILKFDFLSN